MSTFFDDDGGAYQRNQPHEFEYAQNNLLACGRKPASQWSDLIEEVFNRLQLLNDFIYFIRRRVRRAYEHPYATNVACLFHFIFIPRDKNR